MSLLEAMSIGTTIVGHSVGGIDQLLDNGSNGWPVTEHCAPGYARVVAAAMADPQARSQRSRAASEIVRLHYSASACASRHLSLYLELVGQPKTFNAKGRSLR
jgi:glycosyltransferase involved in cell wall biosynthesis